MKSLSRVRFALAIAAFFTITACGGGGGGGGATGDTGSSGGQVEVPEPETAAFSGFDFPLQAGNFWEYRWDYFVRSGGQGISTTTTRDQGRFWVVLGPERTINGVTAHEVQLYGKSQAPDQRFAPRWRYLALAGNRILGSADGTTLETIFDAQKGSWPGGGFFTAFGSTTLVTARSATLTNDYIDTSAISAGRSFNQSQCEFFPGIGTICGSDTSQTVIENDYYKPDVGPIGYFLKNTFSSCGGGFCSFSEREHHLGLTASSFAGGSLPFVSESTTLHNGPSNAQAAGMPAVIQGDVHEADGGFSTTVLIGGQSVPVVIEDWYRVTLAAQRTLTITLSFEGNPTADVDLYLFTNAIPGPSQHSASVTDNVAENISNETISVTLAAGTYYIAVDGWQTTDGRVPYVLQVE